MSDSAWSVGSQSLCRNVPLSFHPQPQENKHFQHKRSHILKRKPTMLLLQPTQCFQPTNVQKPNGFQTTKKSPNLYLLRRLTTKTTTCLLGTSTRRVVSGGSWRGTDCAGRTAGVLQVKLRLRLPNPSEHLSIAEPTRTRRGARRSGTTDGPVTTTAAAPTRETGGWPVRPTFHLLRVRYQRGRDCRDIKRTGKHKKTEKFRDAQHIGINICICPISKTEPIFLADIDFPIVAVCVYVFGGEMFGPVIV